MSDNRDDDVVPESDGMFYSRGKSWEADRERQSDFMKVLGWRLFYVTSAFCVLLVIAVCVLVARHKPIAFLVEHDRATREMTTIMPLDETKWNVGEIEAKHDIARYVLARESYYYPLLQRDYNLVMDMSCDDPEHPVAQEYNQKFDGDKALDKVLGAGTEWRVELDGAGVRLIPGEPGKAVVTFIKSVYHGITLDPNSPPTRHEVSISFKYEPTMLAKESVWVNNPRGFRVCAYRADRALATEIK